MTCVHSDSGDVKVRAEKSDKKRSGYCECCGVRFDDFIPVSDMGLSHGACSVAFLSLDQHVKGDQHVAYATNPENFTSLDAFYDMYKIPTLDQFVDAHAIRCVCLLSVYNSIHEPFIIMTFYGFSL